MKKLLPLAILALLAVSCKKDTVYNSGAFCNNTAPDYILAGGVNSSLCYNISGPTDTLTYNQQADLVLTDSSHTARLQSLFMGNSISYGYWVRLDLDADVEYIAEASTELPKRLNQFDTINANANWQSNPVNTNAYLYYDNHAGLPPYSTIGNWVDGNPGYIGLRVLKNGTYYYGWAQVQVNANTNFYLIGWVNYRY